MGSPLFCSICGAAAQRLPPPGRVRRLRDWFVDGDRHWGDHYACANGHGWTSTTMHERPAGVRWRLRGLWRAVAHERTVYPTPQSYTLVAGVGVIVGIAAQLIWGLPWWLGPVAAVVLAWTLTTATAFAPANRADTADAIHDQLRPRDSLARHLTRMRRDLEQLSFEPVGLADNTGPVFLGGTGGQRGQLTEVSIVYGDPRLVDAPLIEVTTSIDGQPLAVRQDNEEHRLRTNAAGWPHLANGPEMLAWDPVSVTVDGSPRPAHRAALDGGWTLIIEDTSPRIVVVHGQRGASPKAVTALHSVDPTEYSWPTS